MGALLPMVGAGLEELVLLLRGLRNQISSSAHSGVVRRHFGALVTWFGDEKSIRLKSLPEVPRERLDYWQMRRRTS